MVTYSAAPGGGSVPYAITTSGGDTTTGWRTPYSRNDADGAGPGLTVSNSQNGDIVFHMANVLATTIVFDGGETTTTTTTNDVAGSTFSIGLSTKGATGADTGVGCTDNATYSEIGVALIGASSQSQAPRSMHQYRMRTAA